MENELLFLIQTPDGHKYELYLNGVVKGFPGDSIVINRAPQLYDKLNAQIREMKLLHGISISAEKTNAG